MYPKMIELQGLTSEEAEKLLQKHGLNTIPEEKHNPWILFFSKFWDPVPWMLEITIVLEIFLKKFEEAWIIGALILANAFLSFLQESKAKNALRLLRQKLDIQTRVLRDGKWKLIPAQELVPQDVIRLRMGDFVPADANVLEGHILVDQSMITGESLPIEPRIGDSLYAGSIIKNGEAYVKISLTGKNTFFGKTAEILRTTKTPSHLQQTIFSIVKYLAIFDSVLILFAFLYSFYQGIPLSDMIPFSLLLLVASVPAALPATYTLSTALGSMDLAKEGVLVTRLSAIEEAAAMDVLCVDKTGTITQNSLQISALHAFSPYSKEALLNLAAMACEEATQDPLDLAILKASSNKSMKKIEFIPFDPMKKYSGAIIQDQDQKLSVFKGAFSALCKMIDDKQNYSKEIESLSADGSRVLGVIVGAQNKFHLAGLIAFQDPPRETSKSAIQEIQGLKIKTIMVTGDGLTTAKSIADKVGIGSRAIIKDEIRSKKILETDVIAEVFPEDKFHIIQQLQNEGRISGMTGDGVNDAPALKKAEVGIAVSNATDVAKAAASLVLTNPGLVDIIKAVKSSRQIYQRMLTYTINKIVKTLEISILLSLGLILFNDFIISQILIVLLLFTNDFVTMSIATDKVSFSQMPDQWNIKQLMLIGSLFATFILVFSFFVLFTGSQLLHLSIQEIRTLIFLTLVFTGQATIYLVRERKHFWHSMPSSWMLICSGIDIVIVSIFAIQGLLMTPIDPYLILGLFSTVIIYFFFLDFLKVWLIKKFSFINSI